MRVLAILVTLTIAGCGAKPNEFKSLESELPTTTDNLSEISNQCWIYPQFKLGACEALTAISNMSQTESSFYTYPNSSDPRYQSPMRLVDLKNFPVHASLTKNFKVSEFVSEHKGRYAILLAALVETVQVIRNRIKAPLRVNSGYRSPSYNKAIGGATFSRHMYGDGVDLAAPTISVHELKNKCIQAGASYVQVYADGHVHCDWRNYPLDSTFYGKDIDKPLTPTALSTADFLVQQYEIGGKPEITIQHAKRSFGDLLVLEAHLEHQEDPGELLVEWMVQTPEGSIEYYTGKSLEYNPRLNGGYKFTARVGGFVETSTEIDIP